MAELDYKKIHVMLIDDEPFIIKLVERMLKDLGVTSITSAGDGEAAIERLKLLQSSRHPVDVVVCDVEMPIMNGLEFVAAIRGGVIGISPTIPIIVLTGVAEEETVHQAVELKIDGYIVKPVSPKALDRRLRLALAAGDRG